MKSNVVFVLCVAKPNIFIACRADQKMVTHYAETRNYIQLSFQIILSYIFACLCCLSYTLLLHPASDIFSKEAGRRVC
jgi:hypothetical protein